MAELSPATQVVIDAWWNAADGEYIDGVWTPNRSAQLAAALEAVADQVVPKEWPTIEDYNEYDQGVAAAHIKCRNQLLAIAAELRGDTTAQEDNND